MNEKKGEGAFDWERSQRTNLSSVPRNDPRGILGPESLKPETEALVRCATTGLRSLKGESGSGLVEYGIVFVLFFTMILGIMDFSRALYSYHFLSNLTRDATRWAAVNGSACPSDNSCSNPATQADVQTYINNRTPPGIDTTKITTTVTWPVNTDSPAICGTTQNAPGCTVQVTSSYTFNFMFSWIRTSSMTLSSTSEMIISH